MGGTGLPYDTPLLQDPVQADLVLSLNHSRIKQPGAGGSDASI